MKSSPDVAVVGGGLIGLACARAVAARGLRVVVLEAGEPARQASWASAGMLAPLSESPPAESPPALATAQGIFFEVCRHSRDLWRSYAPELQAESGLELDYDTSGALFLPESEGRLATLAATAAAVGEPSRLLDAAAARELLPDLAPRFEQLLLLPGEHRVDNRALCAALLERLGRQGALLRSGWPVAAIEPGATGALLRSKGGETLHAGQVVLAAGAWSGQIAGLPPLPLAPVHGQMFALGEVDWPWQGCVRGEHFYAVRRAGGKLLVGATAEEIGFTDKITAGGLAALAGWATASFPGVAARPLLDMWSGLRPATPNRLPLLGPLAPNVWVATAHFRNGVLLAPWTAERIAGLVLGIEPPAERDRQALALFAP